MKQWMTLFKKEMIENWRNKKWIWVPIVMMVICSMDLVTYYFLPEILDTVGGVPEGAIMEIPEFTPNEAILLSLEQLSMFGVIVIVLISMGTIAGERHSGISEIILVKPVRYLNYVTSKWIAYVLIANISLLIGMLIAWYYTNLLYGSVEFAVVIKIILFYSLWFTLIVTLSIFFNTIFRVPGLVVAGSMIVIVVMAAINTGIGHRFTWFPNQLSYHIMEMTATGTISRELILTSSIIGGLILILLSSSILLVKKKELVK